MNQEFYNAVREHVRISQQKWVEWHHEQMGLTHCGACLSLHGCWFVFENAPVSPLHENCHCTTVTIPTSRVKNNAKVTSAYSKFDPYLFNTLGEYSHGKEKLFTTWGYTADDAHWLQEKIEEQGRTNYITGNYTLGKLNTYGQRLNIRVEIPRKDGQGTVSFITGWTVQPYGELKLNTPYGGS